MIATAAVCDSTGFMSRDCTCAQCEALRSRYQELRLECARLEMSDRLDTALYRRLETSQEELRQLRRMM